jgi:hypothetical protein
MSVVSTTNLLHGIWLLKGTGVILAVGGTRSSPGVDYRIDDKGTIDVSAADDGTITVPTAGQIVVKSNHPTRCPDVTLQNASASDYTTFSATVTADPCNRFAGQTTLQWIRIN